MLTMLVLSFRRVVAAFMVLTIVVGVTGCSCNCDPIDRGAFDSSVERLKDETRADRVETAEAIAVEVRRLNRNEGTAGLARELWPFLRDDNDAVRYWIAHALSELGPDASEAVPHLLTALADRAEVYVSKDSSAGIVIALDRIEPAWRGRDDVPEAVLKRW